MKIKEIRLTNFKRFTDLIITDIPEEAKLVVLIGKNGSGKSSVFEGFNAYIAKMTGDLFLIRDDYNNKVGADSNHDPHIDFHDGPPNFLRHGASHHYVYSDVFRIRTAYRNEAQIEYVKQPYEELVKEERKNPRLSYFDSRITTNYARLTSDQLKQLRSYDEYGNQSAEEIIYDSMDLLNRYLGRVFPGLKVHKYIDETILFRKDEGKPFPYKNLSAGEKAVLDLLLDLYLYDSREDTPIIVIDEPDIHLHANLESNLLKAIFELTPDETQTWIATHSIGMLRKAIELKKEFDNQVVFLDFDIDDQNKPHNFEGKAIIKPSAIDRKRWRKIFSVALDDLANLVSPKTIIICEGKDIFDKDGKPFDVKVYERIFGDHYPDVEFIGLGSENDITKHRPIIRNIIEKLHSDSVTVYSVFDKDNRNDIDFEYVHMGNNKVLSERDIENYVWSDEIIQIYLERENKLKHLNEIIAEKNKLLDLEAFDDDVKEITGRLYAHMRKKRCIGKGHGNTGQSFALDQLVPLIQPGTKTYDQLHKDIFE